MANDPLTIQGQNPLPFQQLPEAIKDWLTSDKVIEIIAELEDKFSIFDDKIKVMPRAITQIVIGYLEPEDFGYQIKEELEVPTPAADEMTKVLKEQVLRPIGAALKNVNGIDIERITLPGGSVVPNNNLSTPARLKPLITGMNISTTPASPKPFLSQPTSLSTGVTPATPTSSAPFPILTSPTDIKPPPPIAPTPRPMPPVAPSPKPFAPSLPPPIPPPPVTASFSPSPVTPVILPAKPISPPVQALPISDTRRPEPIAVSENTPMPPPVMTSRVTTTAPLPTSTPAPSEKKLKEQATTKTGPKPFMLHEEKPMMPAVTEKQSFSFSVPLNTRPLGASSKPVEARFGSAFEDFAKREQPASSATRTGDQKPKIIHYSTYRTLVDPNTGLPTQASLPAQPKNDKLVQ